MVVVCSPSTRTRTVSLTNPPALIETVRPLPGTTLGVTEASRVKKAMRAVPEPSYTRTEGKGCPTIAGRDVLIVKS